MVNASWLLPQRLLVADGIAQGPRGATPGAAFAHELHGLHQWTARGLGGAESLLSSADGPRRSTGEKSKHMAMGQY